MEILKKLSPAEVSLILFGDNILFKNVIKYTFIDLVLKDVLIIEEQSFQAGDDDPVQQYLYVKTGKNFKSYQSKVHEEAFLEVFKNHESIEIMFRHYVMMIYENVVSRFQYLKSIRRSLISEEVFKNSFFCRIFGLSIYTSKGLELKNEIQHIINDLNVKLPKTFEESSDEFTAIIKQINGNILLTELSIEYLKKIESQFPEMDVRPENTAFYFFDYMSDVDIEFDGFDEIGWGGSDSGCSGDSGCSSCSGCSGCSGCGGCGGCGG